MENQAQSVFFTSMGESPVVFVLIISGVLFGIWLQSGIDYMVKNNKEWQAVVSVFAFFVILGYVGSVFGLASIIWIVLATLGGFFWRSRISRRMADEQQK